MKSNVRYAVGGILLALLTIRLFVMFASPVSHTLFALFLATTACVYLGAALSDSRLKWISIEFLMFMLFFSFSALGMIYSPDWLAAGFILHGLWDMTHHPRMVKTTIVRWFPPLCALFDFVVAAYILSFF